MTHNNIRLILACAAAVSVASCSQEPLNPTVAVKEEYTKNFISEFGIPAAGHDFAMAKSAGLKVKTAKGGHVTVTAEVDGKDYLFADVNLTPGIHDLPVTIPQSVTTLKIRSGFKTIEAGVNDIVDIDATAPASRGVDISLPGNYGLVTFTDNDDEAPVIVFNPDQFLNEYLNTHPKGKDSTYKWYMGKDQGKGYIQPYLHDSIYVYYGEIALGSSDLKYDPVKGLYFEGLHYLVFPVWWNTNKYGSKDYRLTMAQYLNFIDDTSYNLPFNDVTNPQIPFPQLGYSTSEISPEDVMAHLSDFTYDTGTSSHAFDPAVAKTVVSKGIKVDFAPDENSQSAVIFNLRSGTEGTDSYSYSSTAPYLNAENWQKKYFDVTLSDLMYSTVSTMLYPLEGQNFEVLNYRANNNIGQSDPRYCDAPFLIGFTSQPRTEADTDPRDYTDLILLVLPTHGQQMLYTIADPPKPYIWTMAVEDLGGTDDWDFNDVVFHFTDVLKDLNSVNGNNIVTNWSGTLAAKSVRIIDVWPEATGGTMPIYITFSGIVSPITSPLPEWGETMFSVANKAIEENLVSASIGTFIVGKEIHAWLGASSYTEFVNVGDRRTGKTGEHVQFAISPYQSLAYAKEGVFGSMKDSPLYGFALLVDKDNNLKIDAINAEEKGVRAITQSMIDDDTYILIGAPDENGSVAPQMLLIGDDDGSWQWPTERTKISDAYPGFNAWVSDRNNNGWTKNPEETLVTKK